MGSFIFEKHAPIIVLKPMEDVFRIIYTTILGGFVGAKFLKEGHDLEPMDVKILKHAGAIVWIFLNGKPEGRPLELIISG